MALARCRLTAAKARAKAKAKAKVAEAEAEATVADWVDFGCCRRRKHDRPSGQKPTAHHPAKPGRFLAPFIPKEATWAAFQALAHGEIRCSLALLGSFHGALRLTRCTYGHHLANLVTTCGRICLRVQRELLRVQRLRGQVRLGGAFRRFHGGSRLPAQWLCGWFRKASRFRKALGQPAGFPNCRRQSRPAPRCRPAACCDQQSANA